VHITAGYRRPDGTLQTQEVANLGLRRRWRNLPADTITITAASDEMLVVDASPTSLDPANDVTGTTTTGAMTTILRKAIAGLTPTVTGSTGPAVTLSPLGDKWDAIETLADSIGADIYDDGTRAWYITPRPTLGTAVVHLATGAQGTVLEVNDGMDRETFYNRVYLLHEWWDSTNTRRIIESVKSATGTYAPTSGNTRTLELRRTTPVTQAQADNAAQALVNRSVSRGSGYDLRAVSAYWVRPGDTVSTAILDDPPGTGLVSRVSFDLRTGLMDLSTRLPE
jgi:hypothetical protein